MLLLAGRVLGMAGAIEVLGVAGRQRASAAGDEPAAEDEGKQHDAQHARSMASGAGRQAAALIMLAAAPSAMPRPS